MLVLSEAATRELVDPDAVLSIIETVARAEAQGRVIMADSPEQRLVLSEPRCRYRVKLCALPDLPVVGIRIIGYPLGREGHGPSTRFVLLSEPATGEPLALIDDHWTYTLRTAASAVVGLRSLLSHRPVAVGMVGAGNLAGAVLLLLHHIGMLGAARVTSRRQESREAFARSWSEKLGLPIEAVDSVSAAAAGCDLLITATSAGAEIVTPQDVRQGMTLCTLGQYELAPAIYSMADKLVVDSWSVARGSADMKKLVESGIVSKDRVYAELRDLVTKSLPGRERADETIIFRTDGLVSQDVAINYVVYQTARDRGVGLVA